MRGGISHLKSFGTLQVTQILRLIDPGKNLWAHVKALVTLFAVITDIAIAAAFARLVKYSSFQNAIVGVSVGQRRKNGGCRNTMPS